MPGLVRLENIRNVAELEFALPDRGVWLLTASNGAGKSSLLACLRRIGYRLAFPVHFPGSQRSERLDSFKGAKVTYELNEEAVTYAYSGVRWVPTPKKGASLFENFGYKRVIYLAASADRITPRPEDFDVRNVKKAKKYIIDNANQIFSSDRFDDLRTVNLTRGVGNQAFVMGHDDSPKTYHSEKNFSMGELCILNLLKNLEDCPNNSLVLIDELELALHPRAQIELLRFLEREAAKKSLTVLFSTHSVSLLKAVHRSRILFLSCLDEGKVELISGCFPTFALGNIALDEERSPDSIIYVEDEMALSMVEPILKLCVTEKYKGTDLFPTIRVLPIGAFHAVVKFLRMNLNNLPSYITQSAVLDEDVKIETLNAWTQSGESAKLAEFNAAKKHIYYLPWTPEVALCESIHSTPNIYRDALRGEFMDNQLKLALSGFDELSTLTGKPLRDKSKQLCKGFIRNTAERLGSDTGRIRKVICETFAREFVSHNRKTAMTSFAPYI